MYGAGEAMMSAWRYAATEARKKGLDPNTRRYIEWMRELYVERLNELWDQFDLLVSDWPGGESMDEAGALVKQQWTENARSDDG